MDAVPQPLEGRGIALLAAHAKSLEPDAPTARERLDAAVGPALASLLVFALSATAPGRRAAA